MNKPPDAKPYFAHSANPAGHWHLLKNHLATVAKLAEAHAGAAPWSDEAAFAGLLHDLGKYADRFQERLKG
jgi:CRISPR-associated endonuclease/helicase Cas3